MTAHWAKEVGNKGVFIPMHRGAAGFMSDAQFAEFYWPNFKALLLGLIDAGLIIDSTMGLPDESKPENVLALTEAVHEYGVY